MKVKISICLALMILLLLSGVALAGSGGGGSATPSYYTFDDLKNEAEAAAYSFYFYNYYKPGTALANLPYSPAETIYCKLKRQRRNVKGFGVKVLNEYSFPWDYISYNLRKGDLIFLRSGGIAGYVVRYVSSFTHVAILYDAPEKITFESLKSNGVNLYYPSTRSWDHIVTYSVKRIKSSALSSTSVEQAVAAAVRSYSGKPYFPNLAKNRYSVTEYFRKWSDKNDMDSMYCSKLVYQMFKGYGINFDTNRTRSWGYPYYSGDYDFNGSYVMNAWIGVSPDDVYYSDKLDSDLYLEGAENLDDMLSGSLF
ncbi:MAG: YiiX/YebB-like N1pC/P60 family cysteine hydrolase [Candidatus Margulisiibacteriota bacterium]